MIKIKIMIYMIAMVFALTLGVAYANEEDVQLYNGITDFTGRSYDLPMNHFLVASETMHATLAKSSHDCCMPHAILGTEQYNGITDFTGRSYDVPKDHGFAALGAVHAISVEGPNAGGQRMEKATTDHPFNGITDFSEKSYDSLTDLSR